MKYVKKILPKSKVICLKKNGQIGRRQEHQERKQWMKRQAVYHTYGTDDDDDEDEEVTDKESNRAVTTKRAPVRRTSTTATRSKCKCGSSEHRYTSHHLCPLNKKIQASSNRVESDTTEQQDSSDSNTEEVAQLFCTCGSDRATHSRLCPLNPRNYRGHSSAN